MKVVLNHVTKVFPSQSKKKSDVVAVNDFDLTIPDGKLIALLGPSGCGKSTTLNLISGLLEPTSGSIYFGDNDVTKIPPENRGIGLVFQNYALYPHLTVMQNITFPLENLKKDEKLTKEQMKQKALEAAKLVQIEEYLDRKPAALSGGQQQRVAIARALVKQPRVLLLDEPLSNLDARLRLQTREEIRRIQKKTKVTTVFVTHDQEEAMSISDLIVVMKDGVVQQVGKPQEVYDKPVNLFVAKFLGTPQINVFNGEIVKNKLYIGQDEICELENAVDQKVHVAIRPEGFIINQKGALHCDLINVEVMGRDTSVVCDNKESQNLTIRTIVPSDNVTDISGQTISFDIKETKMHLYNIDSEERIEYNIKGKK